MKRTRSLLLMATTLLFIAACGSSATQTVQPGSKVSAQGYSATLPGTSWVIDQPTNDVPKGIVIKVVASGAVKFNESTGSPTSGVTDTTLFIHLISGIDSAFPDSGVNITADPLSQIATSFFSLTNTATSSVTAFHTATTPLHGASAVEYWVVSTQLTTTSASSTPQMQTTVNYLLFARHDGSFYTFDVTCLPEGMSSAQKTFYNLLNSWKWS